MAWKWSLRLLAVLVAGLAVAVIAAALLASGILSPPPALPPPHPPPNPGYKTAANGNLSIPTDSPNYEGSFLQVSASAMVSAQVQLKVLNFTAADIGLIVRVPGLVASFPTVANVFKIPRPESSITIRGPGWSPLATLGPNTTLATTTFNTTQQNTPPRLSSQLVSVTTSAPWPSVSLRFQWTWSIVDPGSGKNDTLGNWSGQDVVPDTTIQLASTSSHRVVPGGSFTACISGPVTGRTFSLHAETINPYDDFTQVNATVPSDATLPFCWTVDLPNYLAIGQTILAHVWDYQQSGGNVTTFLLYVIPLTTVAPPPTGGTTVLGVPAGTFLGYVSLAAGLAIAGLVVLTVWRGYRRAGPGGGLPPRGAGGPPPGAATGGPPRRDR